MRRTDGVTGARRAARWGTGLVAVLVAVGIAGTAAGETVSLSLGDAIEIGMASNREIAMAQARADAAEARLGQARAGFLPRITASGSYTRLDEAPSMDTSSFGDMFAPLMVPFEYLVEHGYLDPATLEGLEGGGEDKIYLGDDDVYSLGLHATQPIFTGGAILSAHGAAKHAAAAETLAQTRSTEQVRYDITTAYLGLVQAREAVRVMDDTAARMASHLSDVEAMYEQGMVIQSDLMLARVRMSEIELARTRTGHAARLAEAALAFVLGIDLETGIDPTDQLEGAADMGADLAAWTESALAQRSDLRAMGELVGAADNGVSLARSAYFPQIVAVGTYAWDRPNREYDPRFYEHWSVTVAAQMNVFDWGGTQNRVKEARAGLAEVTRAMDLTEDAVRLEVKQSFLAYQEATEALPIAEDALAQAREGLRVAEVSFENGIATESTVLDAQASLTTAEMNRIAALAGLRLAEAGLEFAAGVAGR